MHATPCCCYHAALSALRPDLSPAVFSEARPSDTRGGLARFRRRRSARTSLVDGRSRRFHVPVTLSLSLSLARLSQRSVSKIRARSPVRFVTKSLGVCSEGIVRRAGNVAVFFVRCSTRDTSYVPRSKTPACPDPDVGEIASTRR